MKFPWMSKYMHKINFIAQCFFEILKFKKVCNLIGQDNFAPLLKNKNFA